jgi:flagellar FliL protein
MEEKQVQEASEATPKKKGGKLPVLLALLVMLAGGGFFGFKLMTKGKAAKVEVKLGATVLLNEFLVNLNGGGYARAEIALHVREGYTQEELEKHMPALRDAIVLTLSSKSLRDVASLDGKVQLKREIGSAVNAVLVEDGKGKEAHGGSDVKEHGRADDPKSLPPDWISSEGPVLKVYLTSFATQ